MLKKLGIGASAGALGMLAPMNTKAQETYHQATRGLKPIKITNVKAIATAPQNNIELIVVKVETSEPGLYGIGCATFRQRAHAVVVAVDQEHH